MGADLKARPLSSSFFGARVSVVACVVGNNFKSDLNYKNARFTLLLPLKNVFISVPKQLSIRNFNLW